MGFNDKTFGLLLNAKEVKFSLILVFIRVNDIHYFVTWTCIDKFLGWRDMTEYFALL